jgi:hypothetical protein
VGRDTLQKLKNCPKNRPKIAVKERKMKIRREIGMLTGMVATPVTTMKECFKCGEKATYFVEAEDGETGEHIQVFACSEHLDWLFDHSVLG